MLLLKFEKNIILIFFNFGSIIPLKLENRAYGCNKICHYFIFKSFLYIFVMCKLHFCQVSTFLTNEYSLWTAVGAALSVFITGLFLAFPPEH